MVLVPGGVPGRGPCCGFEASSSINSPPLVLLPPTSISQGQNPALLSVQRGTYEKRGNGRPIDNTMASKDESPKTQRTISPQAEHTSPKKRRKVNHGGYD